MFRCLLFEQTGLVTVALDILPYSGQSNAVFDFFFIGLWIVAFGNFASSGLLSCSTVYLFEQRLATVTFCISPSGRTNS